MKTLYRRQKQQYVFAGALGVIAVVNLLFFLVMHQPVRDEYFRSQASIQTLRVEVQQQQQEIHRLEGLNAQLEGSAKDRERLFTMHFIPRQDGFAEILPQLDRIAMEAGVRKTRVDYTIDDASRHGLYSVKMRVPVSGGYSNVVNFIRALEYSDTFFIINAIEARGTGDSTEDSTAAEVALSMDLETFFYE